MESMVLFGNTACPYCVRVMTALEHAKVPFEFVVIPMAHHARSSVIYGGSVKSLAGKSFGDIFGGNVSIPKAISADGKKLMDSKEILSFVQSL